MTSAAEVLTAGADLEREQLRELVDRALVRACADYALTPKQREVAVRVFDGALYKHIAAELGMSWRTVRMHTEEVYRKLGVCTRGEMVAKILGRLS